MNRYVYLAQLITLPDLSYLDTVEPYPRHVTNADEVTNINTLQLYIVTCLKLNSPVQEDVSREQVRSTLVDIVTKYTKANDLDAITLLIYSLQGMDLGLTCKIITVITEHGTIHIRSIVVTLLVTDNVWRNRVMNTGRYLKLLHAVAKNKDYYVREVTKSLVLFVDRATEELWQILNRAVKRIL